MAKSYLKLILSLFFFVFVIPMTVTHCTSSDDDETVLEEELENLDNEGGSMADDIDDLDDLAENDLEEITGDENTEFSAGESDFEEIDLDEGDADFGEESAEFADEDFDDTEFSEEEFSEEEFADGGDFGGEGAGDEKELAQEIQGQPQDYPVAQNAQPQFPEEVMGAGEANGGPMDPPPPPPMGEGSMGVSPIPPPGQPLITSETTAIMVPDDAIEPQMPQDDLGEADPIVPPAPGEPEEKPTWIPVVKIKTDPFYRNKRLLNAVYLARPGDTFASISDKIYKDDRVADIKADNQHLLKGIDPGDKVYYNSPNRPDDTTQLKVYYGDIGLPPQYYSTQKNDNMRRLGSKLLGFSEGWKEIWAINQTVDSKTILPKGLELKYWTGNETNPANQVADVDENNPGMTDPEAIEGTAGTIEPGFDDPPMEDMGEVELPPEPPISDSAVPLPEPVADPQVPDMEPFPEEGVESTPGPAPVAISKPQSDQSLLTVGAVALLVIAGLSLVAIQINKRRDKTGINPQSLEYTQV